MIYGNVSKEQWDAALDGMEDAVTFAEWRGRWPDMHLSEGPLTVGKDSTPWAHYDLGEKAVRVSVQNIRTGMIEDALDNGRSLEDWLYFFAALNTLHHLQYERGRLERRPGNWFIGFEDYEVYAPLREIRDAANWLTDRREG